MSYVTPLTKYMQEFGILLSNFIGIHGHSADLYKRYIKTDVYISLQYSYLPAFLSI